MAVIKNLGIDYKKISNIKIALIKKHHWSPLQLRHFTPMKYSSITKIAYIVEKCIFIRKNNTRYFYNVPNYLIDLVRKKATSYETEKMRERREILIHQMRDREKKSDEKRARENIN